MSPPQHFPLPQELIDSIIDQLQDSRRDLLACALVGHAWLPQCRKHLFRVISCGPELSKPGETSEEPLFRIARAPIFAQHIPPLVHQLTFDCAYSPELLTMLLRSSSFIQLRHLTLSNVPLRHLHHTETRSLPEFLGQCPSLEHLALVKVPMRDISQLCSPDRLRNSRLRSLTLHSLTCTEDIAEQAEDTLLTGPRVELETLELKDVDPDLVDMLFCRHSSPFTLDSLKELRLGDDGFEDLLREFGSSITHLSLHPPIASYTFLLNPYVLPQLRHLTVTGNDFKHDAIPSILFQLGSSGLELQTLTLPLTVLSAGYPEVGPGHDKLVCEFIRDTPSLERIVLSLRRKSKLRYHVLMSHPVMMVMKQREILMRLIESVKTGKLDVQIESDGVEWSGRRHLRWPE